MSTSQILQTVQQYEELLLQQAHQHMSVPTTPEGNLPGTNMSPHGNGFSSFTFPSMHSHMNGTPGSMRGGRGRSSSMLSNVSGFTDAFDEPASSGTYVLGNPSALQVRSMAAIAVTVVAASAQEPPVRVRANETH